MEFKGTRAAFAAALTELGSADSGVMFVSPDSLKAMRATSFAEKMPGQYVEVGIAEQAAVDEAERRGISRDAAVSFLTGHIYNLTCNFLGYIPGRPPVSDACKVAIGLGSRLVMREDWKRIWDDEVLHKVIATMLHPEDPKI